MMIKPEDVWWRRVPVAVNFIEQCIADAKEFKPSYIDSRTLPWADQFLKMTRNVIREMSQSFTVYTVDGSRFDAAKHDSILDLMVEAIGSPQQYDCTIQSVWNELNSSMIFFLVKAKDKNQLDELKMIVFDAKEYEINLRLIVQSDISAEEDPDVKAFEYHNFDVNFFIWNLLLGKNSTNLLNYKAGLATLLADRDAEKAAACCKEIDNCVYDPDKVCNWLDPEVVKALVRKAKIRYLVPELEMARINFGNRVKDRIAVGILPYKDFVNGEQVLLELEELEFKHFSRIAKNYRNLQLTPGEKEMLDTLYEARNALAHIATKEEVLTIDFIIKVKEYCDELEK